MRVFSLFCLFLVALAVVSVSAKDCDNSKPDKECFIKFTECASNGKYKLDKVLASSWPPVIGGPAVNLTQTVNLKEDVTSGSWKSTSKIFGIAVDTQTGDLCNDYGNFKCPAKQGQVTIVSAVVPPASAPLHGTLTSIAQLYLNGGDVAGCWQVSFDI